MTELDPGAEIWTRTSPYLMTWSDFGILAERLCQAVRADGFRPDALCCIARGGFVVAGYLALALDVACLDVVRVRRTVDDEVYARKQAPQLWDSGTDRRGARRILIVDDIVGTGATAQLVDRHLRETSPADIRFAALLHNPRSAYHPGYRALEVDDWVVFPWEATADTTAGRALDLQAAPA